MSELDPNEWANKAVQAMHTESLECAHEVADSQKAELSPQLFHNVRAVFEKGFRAGIAFAERMSIERAKP